MTRRSRVFLAAASLAAVDAACAGKIFKERLPGPAVVPGGVLFQYDSLSADSVHVAGQFNGWAKPTDTTTDARNVSMSTTSV